MKHSFSQIKSYSKFWIKQKTNNELCLKSHTHTHTHTHTHNSSKWLLHAFDLKKL